MSGCRQGGAAVVLALLVVALAAAIAADLVWRQHVWLRQVENDADYVQGKAVADAGLQWARAILADDERSSSVDHRGEPWATRLPATTVESGEISGYILDQQGLLNLRNLAADDGTANAQEFARLRRLLALLALPAGLADGLAAWLEGRTEAGGPASRAPRVFATLGDLASVPGFTPAVIERLHSYVTVLPTRTAVNVNTAPPEVLASLVEGLSLGEAQELAAAGGRAWFKDVADFRSRLPRQALGVPEGALSVQSRYFTVLSQARIGRATVTVEALVGRSGGGWPAVVWQRLR